MGILEKIADIEREIGRTQKNKATEYHLGLLKAKLAKYRSQLIEAASTSKEKCEGFEVQKSGDARVALIGFPSVGKSTLLNAVTKTESATASYAFTTLTCIPTVLPQGVIEYHGANIQLLDLPGIIEGASQGMGRGKQVIAVARTADLVLFMLDASKGDTQRGLLEQELYSVGIRLNCRAPNITFKVKKAGGISFNATCTLTQMNERLCRQICAEYKIHNADILFREDYGADDLIDVISGNRVYIDALYCYNKVDLVTLEECDRLARLPNSVVASCHLGLNMGFLVDRIWERLALIRVYTKRRGEMPDFTMPLVLRGNGTVKDVCHMIHHSMHLDFKSALVWGLSTKHSPQRVGLAHELADEDVIQILKK